MTEPDYAPFPESELRQLADYHDAVAKSAAKETKSTYLSGLHQDRALVCRNAVRSQEALRERCLLAELELAQTRHALELLRESRAAA